MTAPMLTRPHPCGLAFEIETLIQVRSWAERRGMHMMVELDHTLNGEAYDEVLCLIPRGRRRPRILLWRDQQGVALALGTQAAGRFAIVEDALARCEVGHARRRLSLLPAPLRRRLRG